MFDYLNFKQTGICAVILILALALGGQHIASHIIFGILMFTGLVALVENVSWMKTFVYHSNVILDFVIFFASIVATIYMGVTITGAITVASIIYSLIYAPMIRNKMKADKLQKQIEKDRLKQHMKTYRNKQI